MSNDETQWSLEKTIKETRKYFQDSALSGEKLNDLDLSYITQDLLDDYRKNAVEKDASECTDVNKNANVACYWGNNWVILGPNNKWGYTNNHSGTGCDPVTDSCLCGSGQRWSATAFKVTGRHCANGKSSPKMAWARPQ